MTEFFKNDLKVLVSIFCIIMAVLGLIFAFGNIINYYENNKEVSPFYYSDIENMVKNYPALTDMAKKAMEDGIIVISEYQKIDAMKEVIKKDRRKVRLLNTLYKKESL